MCKTDALPKLEQTRFTKVLEAIPTSPDSKEVRLSCTVCGEPEPELYWYFNDQRIENWPDFTIEYNRTTGIADLIIHDSTKYLQGCFKCVAKNPAGQAETEYWLSLCPHGTGRVRVDQVSRNNMGLEVLPRFLQPIQPCVVTEGQSCTFSALVCGNPPPVITWMKEKKNLLPSERHLVTFDETTSTSTLTILNCQPSDTAVYSCRASNTTGHATCSANVVVVRKWSHLFTLRFNNFS